MRKNIPLNYQSPGPARPPPRALLALGCLGRAIVFPIGLILCFLITIGLTYRLTERIFLINLYGADRYAAGLRIVHKHYLNDGTPLPRWVEFTQGLSTFLLALPVIIIYMLIARWLRFHRDEDWQDPRPEDHSA